MAIKEAVKHAQICTFRSRIIVIIAVAYISFVDYPHHQALNICNYKAFSVTKSNLLKKQTIVLSCIHVVLLCCVRSHGVSHFQHFYLAKVV